MEDDPVRPDNWDEFIGQEDLKARLDVRIRAAVAEQRPLGHVFIAAPPGSGKSTLARMIADRLGDPFYELTCPVKPAALGSFLRQCAGGVLLLDEIHRFTKAQQEDLLTLLWQGFLQLPNGRRVEAGWLTIIGATTEPEKITPALMRRFPIRPSFGTYTPEDMIEIVGHMALKAGLDCGIEVLKGIADAAAGNPSAARDLVLGAKDLQGDGDVTMEDILHLCETDPFGLTKTHLEYLNLLRHLGGQAGLDLLANMMRLHPSVVREAERLLVSRNLVMFGERGRELTSAGWNYGKAATSSPRRQAS